jgi:hypothetical protein
LELPRHSDIPLQLHLYTILKNLRLQKYIGTGTKNPLLATSWKEKSRDINSFKLNCKLSR